MVKRRGMLAKGLCVLVALLLAGCAGGTVSDAAQDKASWADDFVGTWSIIDYVDDGQPLSADNLAVAKAMGIYLTLSEDGVASLELMGSTTGGSWEATAAKVGSLTLSQSDNADLSGTQAMKVDGEGHLVMESQSDSMTFEKIDAADKGKADFGALVSEGTGAEDQGKAKPKAKQHTTTVTPPTVLSESTELDVVIADDESYAIRAIGKGVYYGDAGYLIEVENKTASSVFASAGGNFQVDGKERTTYLEMAIEGHDTGSEVLWFDMDQVGGKVSGTIVISDTDHREIKSYPVEL